MNEHNNTEIGNIRAGNVGGSIENRVNVSINGKSLEKDQLIKEVLAALKSEPLTQEPYAVPLYEDIKAAEISGDISALKKALAIAAGLMQGVTANGMYDGLKRLAENIHSYLISS